MSPDMYFDDDDDDEACPDYNSAVAVSRRPSTSTTSSNYTSGSSSSNGHWHDAPPPLRSFASHAQLRRLPAPAPKPLDTPRAAATPLPKPLSTPRATPPLRIRSERYVYTYAMTAAGAPLKFLISVESLNGKPSPGKYTFRLALKACDVERSIGDPVTVRLSVDPRTLEFSVFLFPGKKSVSPAGCLFSLRVWLRANGVDHRIFGEDELWIGKDPDFAAVEDAVVARLRSVTQDAQIYDALVGRARVQFIVRWQHLGARHFKYTLEYDAGGVGMTLIEDLRLTVEGDPRRLTFHIYTIPIRSVPAGASHRVRVWLRSFVGPLEGDASSVAQLLDSSYVYQRVWKSDTFKIGGWLDFEALGPKLIMGRAAGGPPQTLTAESWDARSPESPPAPPLPLVGYQHQHDSKAQLFELA